MTTYAFYSAGGFAREIKSHLSEQIDITDRVVFIDDDPSLWGTNINGCRVLPYDELRTIRDVTINIAFADPALRRRKHEQAEKDGFRFFSVVASNFYTGDAVHIGDAAILCHNSMITSDARVGKAFHLNIYSYVAHDCIVGDFVTCAPKVCINGRVKIEDDVYLGTGAIILPGNSRRHVTIGKGAVIGAGAVVTKDVEPGTTVVGMPARPLRK